MKILLFGGTGQLGFELRKRAEDLSFQLFSPVTSEVDITETEQVRFLTTRIGPDVVLNCAAYTAVDTAESERERAFQVNRDGPRNIALACKDLGCRFIHISTDYVFDGMLGRPLKEDDPTTPLSVYGESKLAGEHEVSAALGDKGLIVRTSSLHGQKGVNFVHTMLKLFREREEIRVVDDQIMSPTWAGWLSETLLDLCRMEVGGIVHASCEGAISWYRFAQEIFELTKDRLESVKLRTIEPIKAAELSRAARRPVYSAFDLGKLTAILGRRPIPWVDGLKGHLKDIGLA